MMMSNLLAPAWLGWAIGLGIVVLLIVTMVIFVPFNLWFRALVSGAYISLFRMIGMKFRKIDVHVIVDTYITAKKAGLNIKVDELETHYMAGGNIDKVVSALISAHSARIPIDIDTAKAIDLAGRDVYEAVKVSVTPKVITTPVVAAIAKDGIELKVIAKVTVRANIGRLIGGAGEETIVARVGEGIVTAIGKSENNREILKNPNIISKMLIEDDRLDKNTAFEILSIDIADVDVGRNVGAALDIEKANADKQIAQAKAEERKSMAEASEKEMKARTQAMQAQVLLAESEVPKAMADAFRDGKLGVMDYYRMQNMVADTTMRKSFAEPKQTTVLKAPSQDGGAKLSASAEKSVENSGSIKEDDKK